MINKIRNLNDLHRGDKLGIFKRWIYKTESNHTKICDYLQKISFSIQDLNGEIENLKKPSMKELIYIISLTDWICESFIEIKRLIIKDVVKDFTFSKEQELIIARNYLKALRSFVIAHPLSTNQHKQFGFDGNFICIDFCSPTNSTLIIKSEDSFYHLDYSGLIKEKDDTDDYFLRSYSERDNGMKYTREIGCKLIDIYRVAELYVDAIYELDKYLYRQKKSFFNDI